LASSVRGVDLRLPGSTREQGALALLAWQRRKNRPAGLSI